MNNSIITLLSWLLWPLFFFMDSGLQRDFHAGSGNAQISSARDSRLYSQGWVDKYSYWGHLWRYCPRGRSRCNGYSGRPWHSCLPALWSSFQERCSPQKPSSKLSTPTRRSNVLLSCQFCQRLFNRPCEVSKHQLSCPSRQASAADSEQAEKELACPLCDRRFKRPCELGRHLQFCKAPAAALRSSRLMTAPLSPAHPGQMPLSGMKAKCIALLIKLVRHPSQHPPVQPARYTSTVLEARRLSSLAPLSVKTRLPDLVSRSMSPFGFLPLTVRATGQTPTLL